MWHYEGSSSIPHDTSNGGLLLLGYAPQNESIEFMQYMNHIMVEEDSACEIEQTLTKALDLLPEFLSIPIGEDEMNEQMERTRSNRQHIDECLHMLQTIDIHSVTSQSHSEQEQLALFCKISQMRQIIERLHAQIDESEGYRTPCECRIQSDYVYPPCDACKDDEDSLIDGGKHNIITLMGAEKMHTAFPMQRRNVHYVHKQ